MRTEPNATTEATRLVGRTAEMATLRGLVGEVASGSSVLLRISGPSGLGKSRLSREMLRLAGEAGFVTVVSRPTEYGEGAAFSAAVDALGPLLRAARRPERARLVGDLPQLGLLFAGVELEPPAPLTDVALQRLVLVEGLCRMVDRVAREGPLLWVVDGFDGVDRASSELLQRLAVTLADRAVLLAITGPGSGSEPASALERACADCGWQRALISLRPLADADAVTLAEDLLGGTASDRLRTTMRERCAGTPLWIVATAQALLDTGRLVDHDGLLELTGSNVPLPNDIEQQFWAIIDGLGPAEQALLVTLSVSGTALPLDVLRDRDSADADAVPLLMSGLERRRLVAWTDTGYDVAHGLLREVVLAHTTDTERRMAHAALARSLRSRDPGDPRIAEHTLGAGPLAGPDLVPVELVQGARRARAVGSTQDAYRSLSAALTAY
ncbi:MAG: AAA family ATPase, partial [Nocardioidaceae bacterium]